MNKSYFFTDINGNSYSEWEEISLGEASTCLDNKRIPLSAQERISIKGTIPYYGATGIVGYINDSIFDEDLVLIGEDGADFENFSTKPIAQFVTGKSWVNNHAHVFRANLDLVLTKFLFYSFEHKDIRQYIVGGGRAKLNKSDALKIKFGLPSLAEQQKIAEFFSALDERIAFTADKVKLLKEQKTGYLQKVFAREIAFTDDNGDQYPEWERKKLIEVANLVTGNTPPTENSSCWDGDYPWATPGDMGRKKYIHNTRRTVTKLGLEKSRYLPAGSLIVTCIGATIGKSAILAVEGSCNQQNNAVLPSDSLSVEYIYYFLETQVDKMKGLAGQTATPILNKTAFGQLLIPLPSLPEQEKIAEFFSALDEQIELTENKLTLLKEQKKGYLQGIFG